MNLYEFAELKEITNDVELELKCLAYQLDVENFLDFLKIPVLVNFIETLNGNEDVLNLCNRTYSSGLIEHYEVVIEKAKSLKYLHKYTKLQIRYISRFLQIGIDLTDYDPDIIKSKKLKLIGDLVKNKYPIENIDLNQYSCNQLHAINYIFENENIDISYLDASIYNGYKMIRCGFAIRDNIKFDDLDPKKYSDQEFGMILNSRSENVDVSFMDKDLDEDVLDILYELSRENITLKFDVSLYTYSQLEVINHARIKNIDLTGYDPRIYEATKLKDIWGFLANDIDFSNLDIESIDAKILHDIVHFKILKQKILESIPDFDITF